MKIVRIFAFLVVIGLATASAARAQSFVYTGPRTLAGNPAIQPSYPFPMQSYGAPRVVSGGQYLPMYDYYSAPYPLPARFYMGYGPNDYPFYGQTYGHPYEPWSWAGLSRYPAYPPVRVSGFVGP